MPAFADTLRHTLDSKLRRIKPEEEQRNPVTLFLCAMHKVYIRLGGQGRLYSKGFIPFEQLLYALQHKTAGLYGNIAGIEGGEPMGNLIGIDKLSAVENIRQHSI